MNSKSVCRFPMQEQKCHCHNGKFTCKNTIEIATDAENRDEKKNCKNTNYKIFMRTFKKLYGSTPQKMRSNRIRHV